MPNEPCYNKRNTGNHAVGKSEPERFYHGSVLGLIADSDINFQITSNRESSLGRYDVMLKPKNPSDIAYVLKFKVHRPKKEISLEDTVKATLDQIKSKNYDASIARGIPQDLIRHYRFSFDGKKVLIG